MDPERLINQKRLVAFVGTGGVGKTTLAASFALEAARRGRRVALLTIDPARRLADALGAGPLDHQLREIEPERLAPPRGQTGGRLFASMLDTKRTFDELVERFAASEAARQRVLQNPIYCHLSEALAGSAEYAAMERVYQLSQRSDFDLIVVDTPPSEHALDFLEAPHRMLALLDSSVVQLLVHPAFAAGRLGMRLFARGTDRVLRLIERVSGVGFLEDITEFLLAFEQMSGGFRSHAKQVEEQLRGPGSAFVLAAAPSPAAMRAGLELLSQLEAQSVPLAGVVLNRTHPWPGDAIPAAGVAAGDVAKLAELLAASAPTGSAETWARTALVAADRYAAATRAEREACRPLEARMREIGGFVRRVPELVEDIHDFDSLVRVATWIFAQERERPA